MSYRREISRVMLAVRPTGALLFLRRAAFGQEGVVGWDPRETGELVLTGNTVLIGLLMALGCGGLWKLLIWFLESRRTTIKWAKVRFWWPTAMLVGGWVLLAIGESWGWAFDTILVVFGVLNFPALLVVAAILESLGQPAAWLRILVGSLVMWGGNYLIVRLAEWRAWANVPVTLHLVDADTSPTKST